MQNRVAARVLLAFMLQVPSAFGSAEAQHYFPGAISCGEPEVSDPSIVAALNAKVGQYGGPPRRVVAIRGAASTDQDTSDAHTRCHGTLVFAGGATQMGLLLQDKIQGIASWRWHSDQELAEGSSSPAHKKQVSQLNDEMRKNALRTPNEVTGCGIEGPQTVYTTMAVCYAMINLSRDYREKLRPYGAYALLQECGRINSRDCLGMIAELEALANLRPQAAKMTLIETCAGDLERKFPGNEAPQYMNTCQSLVDYLN